MHYYQHHIGDFIKATSRLTDTQAMAYLRLLWMYYDKEKPLENKPNILAFQVGTNQEDVELILQSFFTLEDDGWHQSRCDKEIEEYQAFCERQKTNALKGGRPKKDKEKPMETQRDSQTKPTGNPLETHGIATETQRESTGNPTETLTTNHKPLTNNHIIKNNTGASDDAPTLPVDNFVDKVEKPIVAKPKAFDAMKVLDSLNLPTGVNPDLVTAWVKHRKSIGKPFKSQEQLDAMCKQLSVFYEKGFDVNRVITDCIADGYQGLYTKQTHVKQGVSKGMQFEPPKSHLRARADFVADEMIERIKAGEF